MGFELMIGRAGILSDNRVDLSTPVARSLPCRYWYWGW
jgi:hypothetical protein